MSEKLQKVLANQGLGSRREMERWIESGRVSVDGTIASLGDRVEPSAQIRVDGHLLSRQTEQPVCRVLMYNKPEGELCSRSDPEGRATVFDRLPSIRLGRWIAVGRLDINTSGLLLFTNDGELANRLMHPSCEVEREYAVRVFGEVPQQAITALKRGVKLDDGEAKFTSVKGRPSEDDSMNQWFTVTLSEGRNREVRRLWESQNVQVSRLIRLRYGPVELQKRLPQGAWVELPLEEINALRTLVQLPEETTSMVDARQNKLDHARLSRMRRSVKKHRSRGDRSRGEASRGDRSRAGESSRAEAPGGRRSGTRKSEADGDIWQKSNADPAKHRPEKDEDRSRSRSRKPGQRSDSSRHNKSGQRKSRKD